MENIPFCLQSWLTDKVIQNAIHIFNPQGHKSKNMCFKFQNQPKRGFGFIMDMRGVFSEKFQ